MKLNRILLGVLAMALAMSTAFAANLPVMNSGDTYTVTEALKITSPDLGQGGYVVVTGNATYTVDGVVNVTQEKTGNSYDCYKLTATGSAVANGEVFNAGGIITGPVRIQGGTYGATIYIQVSDFATVKKQRVISGTIEYAAGPVWLPLGALSIEENEEYSSPLNEMTFPMSGGESWTQAVTIHAFGEMVVPILGGSDFSQSIDLDTSSMVASGTSTVNGCDSMHTTLTAAGSPVTLESFYCCNSNWVSQYKITNLPFGSTGTVEYVTMDVTSYNVADDSCGGGAGTVGIELTHNFNGVYIAGQVMEMSYRYWNTTSTDYTSTSLWLILEIYGTYYFLPHYSDTILVPVATFDLVTGEDYTEMFLSLQNPGIGVDVNLNWYAGLLDNSYNWVGGSTLAADSVILK